MRGMVLVELTETITMAMDIGETKVAQKQKLDFYATETRLVLLTGNTKRVETTVFFADQRLICAIVEVQEHLHMQRS